MWDACGRLDTYPPSFLLLGLLQLCSFYFLGGRDNNIIYKYFVNLFSFFFFLLVIYSLLSQNVSISLSVLFILEKKMT